MKSYKDFEKIDIGSSDIANLILVGCGDDGIKCIPLHFGGDDDYRAYFCPEKVEIGAHYEKVAEFKHWMKIYDDEELTFSKRGDFNVYRAGEYGCIIVKEN